MTSMNDKFRSTDPYKTWKQNFFYLAETNLYAPYAFKTEIETRKMMEAQKLNYERSGPRHVNGNGNEERNEERAVAD